MKTQEEEVIFSEEDGKYLLTSPLLANRRHVFHQEFIQGILERFLLDKGRDVSATDNVWFWDVDAPRGPRIVLVQMPEKVA